MKQASKLTMFRNAADGSVFVYLSDFPLDGELLFSSDGQTFYALGVQHGGGSYCGDDIQETLSFEDPNRGVTGTLERNNDVIDYDGQRYERVSVVPLPPVRVTEYLCVDEDSTLFYVSRPKYNWDYDSFHLFVGDGVNMRQIPVGATQRYRDGGTTLVYTKEGTFYSPTPFHRELPHEWRREDREPKVLTRLNLDDYDIVETPDGQVTIMKK